MGDPRGAKCDPEKAYLELFPGEVGTGEDLGLTKYDDSYEMFVDDDDDDDEDEDGKYGVFLRYLSELCTGVLRRTRT